MPNGSASDRPGNGRDRTPSGSSPAPRRQAPPQRCLHRRCRLPCLATARQGPLPTAFHRALDCRERGLLIAGPCGVGKTWLACALGQKACRDNNSVIYKRLPRLFSELQPAHDDGRFPRISAARESRPADPGRLGARPADRQPTPRPDGDRRRPLRHGSTMVTSQLPL